MKVRLTMSPPEWRPNPLFAPNKVVLPPKYLVEAICQNPPGSIAQLEHWVKSHPNEIQERANWNFSGNTFYEVKAHF